MAAATTSAAAGNVIHFTAGSMDLPASPQPVLDSIATRMLADDNLRVQVIAHATGSADQAMEARRISLARAVAVRAYLIQKGVRSLRIDVRALGNRAEDGPVTDQVNLLLVNQ
jgi:outer membrane protein OmpA-like peptidoglycan-associated protein